MFWRLIKWLIIALIILVVVVFFSLDFIVKQGIQRVGSSVLGTPVTVGDVSLGLLEGRLTINDLKVENPRGYKQKYAFTLGKVAVKLDISSLFENVIKITNITITNPDIYYQTGLGGSNIGALTSHSSSSAQQSTQTSAPKKGAGRSVEINELLIKNAKVTGSLGIAQTSVTLKEIRMKNLGKQSGGVTVAQVTAQVLSQLVQSLATSGVQVIGGTVKGVVSGVGDAAGKAAKGVGSAIDSIFGK